MRRWIFLVLTWLVACGATEPPVKNDPCELPDYKHGQKDDYASKLQRLRERWAPGAMTTPSGEDARKDAAVWLQCYCNTHDCTGGR